MLLPGGTFMSRLPAIEGHQLVKILQKLGFVIIRTKGSHVRMKAEDGSSGLLGFHRARILRGRLCHRVAFPFRLPHPFVVCNCVLK
jgi:predicted RNA binding protein YcfA (HicA-like mRNA interferase family)